MSGSSRHIYMILISLLLSILIVISFLLVIENNFKKYLDQSGFYISILIIAGIIRLVLFGLFWFRSIRSLQKRAKPTSRNSKDPVLLDLIDEFSLKTRSLSNNADTTLLVIIAVLFFGSVVFLQAGKIAARDALSSTRLELNILKTQIEIKRREIELVSNPNIKKEILRRIQSFQKQETALLDRLRRESFTLKPNPNMTVIISSLSTRIGSVFLLIFLVQILVSLYRYNLRMAAFYSSRADALRLLTKLTPTSFQKYCELLSPTIDFSKEQTPTTQAVELAKQIIQRTSSS